MLVNAQIPLPLFHGNGQRLSTWAKTTDVRFQSFPVELGEQRGDY